MSIVDLFDRAFDCTKGYCVRVHARTVVLSVGARASPAPARRARAVSRFNRARTTPFACACRYIALCLRNKPDEITVARAAAAALWWVEVFSSERCDVDTAAEAQGAAAVWKGIMPTFLGGALPSAGKQAGGRLVIYVTPPAWATRDAAFAG